MQETETMYFDIEGKTIEIHKVKNFEELLTDPTDPDLVPCWAEVWPASVGLARYLAQQKDLEEKAVLELGAGLGVPGVMAALKGAKVTFSDFNRQALTYCEINARANGIQRYEILMADWRNFPKHLGYELVIGSDIMYEPRLLPYLKKVLEDLINQGSKVILSHPSRDLSYEFVKKIENSFSSAEVDHVVNHLEVHLEDSLFTNYVITIHTIQKK